MRAFGLEILAKGIHKVLKITVHFLEWDNGEYVCVRGGEFIILISTKLAVLHMSDVICLTLVSVVTNYVKEMTRDCRYSLSRYYKALQTSAACHVTMSRSRSPLVTKLKKHETFNSRVCERPRHLGAYLGDKW